MNDNSNNNSENGNNTSSVETEISTKQEKEGLVEEEVDKNLRMLFMTVSLACTHIPNC